MKKPILVLAIVMAVFFHNAYAFDDPLDYSARQAWTTYNEFFPYAGVYFGDSLENSWLVGGEYMLHFFKHFGLGVDFGYSKADYSENKYYDTPGFFKNDNIYIIDATGMISVPAAFRVGKSTVEMDLFLLAGGGTTGINESFEPQGFIGGGFKLFVGKPWLAVRLDVRDTFHTTAKPGSDEYDQDLLLILGVSFQIPPRIGASSKL